MFGDPDANPTNEKGNVMVTRVVEMSQRIEPSRLSKPAADGAIRVDGFAATLEKSTAAGAPVSDRKAEVQTSTSNPMEDIESAVVVSPPVQVPSQAKISATIAKPLVVQGDPKAVEAASADDKEKVTKPATKPKVIAGAKTTKLQDKLPVSASIATVTVVTGGTPVQPTKPMELVLGKTAVMPSVERPGHVKGDPSVAVQRQFQSSAVDSRLPGKNIGSAVGVRSDAFIHLNTAESGPHAGVDKIADNANLPASPIALSDLGIAIHGTPLTVPVQTIARAGLAGNISGTNVSAPMSEASLLAGAQHAGYDPADAGSHGILSASPKTIEVGFANGTQGWVRIRAELTDGIVTASLSSGSSAGQDLLHRELPTLTAYLEQERIAVHAVVGDRLPVGQGLTAGIGDGLGSGSQSPGGGRHHEDAHEVQLSSWPSGDEVAGASNVNFVGPSPLQHGDSGGRLNIRV